MYTPWKFKGKRPGSDPIRAGIGIDITLLSAVRTAELTEFVSLVRQLALGELETVRSVTFIYI